MNLKKGQFAISPYPNGKQFAFSIVDDTDLSKGPDIEPVYDLLYELGYRTTKTVWVFDQKHSNSFRREDETHDGFSFSGASLQDIKYLDLIKDLHEKGFEIALHGVSSGNDYRNEIIQGYEEFKRIFGVYPKIDILHAQNIENLYAGYHKLDNIFLKAIERLVHRSDYQGHIEGSAYFWGDICQQHVKYVRLPFHTINEINLLKLNPSFPFHDYKRPYVNYWFPNSNGADYKSFMKLTSPKNIQKLINGRGTTIIYTHFAKGFTEQKFESFILKKSFEERMRYIRKQNGWFATASEILDRFLALKEVFLIHTNETVTVINTGRQIIHGITLFCETRKTLFDNNNAMFVPNNQELIVIGDLPPHSVKTFCMRKNALPRIFTKKIVFLDWSE